MLSAPTGLRCEYLSDPLGIDRPQPRFSWIVAHPERSQRQTAFRLVVSSSGDVDAQEDLWDSGKVVASETFQHRYRGVPLRSDTNYFWRVQWWDASGRMSPFSDVAVFETGILDHRDWQASWIGMTAPAVFRSEGTTLFGKESAGNVNTFTLSFRREFCARADLRAARAHVSGLGFYELRINGDKVGTRVLDPGLTDYRQIALYSTYDVTKHIQAENALAVLLGNGRHTPSFGFDVPKLIVQIHLFYGDGAVDLVVSDKTWKVTQEGALRENGLYYGEHYDARRDLAGWDQHGYDDSSWEDAIVVAGPPLAAQLAPPIRVTERMRPVNLSSPSAGVFVYDFGQNFSGWAKLRVRGPGGTRVCMRYAECLHEDGTLNPASCQNARATDVYMLRGGDQETYEPRFTSHGFRYLEITGYPGNPTLDSVEGCVVHTDVETIGFFSCSHDLINRIHTAVCWSQRSNLMSIPTDCPSRDERGGWLADAHLSAEEAMLNFDMVAFYTKFLDDIRRSQREDGALPDAVPTYLDGLCPADPGWGAAYVTLAWLLYWMYGDVAVLAAHYPTLKRYVTFLQSQAGNHIQRGLGKYGDWVQPGSVGPKRTSLELTSTWFYYHDVRLLSDVAEVLGRDAEACEYRELAAEIRAAFNDAFLEDSQYAAQKISKVDQSPDQTSNLLPLTLDMVPDGNEEQVLESLLRSVVRERGYHLDTGIVGTRYLLDVLTERGHGDVAWRIATQSSYPGWGYMLKEGATTLWERWERIESDGMNSHNHATLGSVDAWFYRALGGLTPLSPAWGRIRFAPPKLEGLDSATARIHSIRGPIKTSWRRENGELKVDVVVPVGAVAEIHLQPVPDDAEVWETGTLLVRNGTWRNSDDEAIRLLRHERATLVVEIGSGSYSFFVGLGG